MWYSVIFFQSLFQTTVGKKHDVPNVEATRNDLALLGDGANKLYWLVSPVDYDTFTEREPYDMDQYAVFIRFPD
jgi:hypothetical protein